MHDTPLFTAEDFITKIDSMPDAMRAVFSQKFTPACRNGPLNSLLSVKPFFLKSYFM